MIKRILPIAILGAAIISNTGCKNSSGEFKETHGIRYKIIKDVPGKNAKIGDVVEFHILAKADTVVLADSRKQQGGKPAALRVDSTRGSGQWQAVFPMLSAGDSALVEISCDTILKNLPPNQQQQLPPWMKKGNKISVYISVVSIKGMEDYQKEMDAKQAEQQKEMKAKEEAQMPIDDKILQDYFAKNNIKAQKTASGLYYTIEKPGTGDLIAKGQTVSMKYTGKTLDGKIFDTNRDTTFHHSTPLTFAVGMHQMIPGMDEGAALLKKGAKATLYVPSPLAYGPQSPGPGIAPNSVLIFDVDVTEVKAASEGKPMPAQ